MRLLLLIFLVPTLSFGATISSSVGTGNWSNPATWIGGIVPGASDDVVISNNSNVIVDVNTSCLSLVISAAGNNTSLIIGSGITLTVSGNVTINPPTGGTTNSDLVIGDGILICNNLYSSNSNYNTSDCRILINNGTITVLNDAVLGSNATRNHFTVSGSGLFQVAGIFSGGGTITTGNGTIEYNGNTQNLNNAFTNYFNLTISNSGTKTLTTAITINGNLNINDNAQLDVSANNFNINLRGNWNVSSLNSDPFVQRAGRVTLNGNSGTQTINTVLAGGETFYNLTINNTSISNPAIESNINLIVENDYDHNNGIIDLKGNNLTASGGLTTAQTFTLNGGGINSSVPGSLVTFNEASATNRTSVAFTGFQILNNITTRCSTANITFSSTRILGDAIFYKLGNGANDFPGGNYFSGPVRFETDPAANRFRFGNNSALPDTFFNATFVHNGSGNYIIAANNPNNAFYGTTTFTQNSSTGAFVFLRNNGTGVASATFHGKLILNITNNQSINIAEGGPTFPHFVEFRDEIEINSSFGSNGGIVFVNNVNASVLLSMNGHFSSNSILGNTNISIRNVNQTSSIANNINGLGGGTLAIGTTTLPCSFNGSFTASYPRLTNYNTTYNGTVNLSAESILIQSNTFNSDANIIKTNGNTTNTSNGGNTFNGDATFTHYGDGTWQLGRTPSGDDFNGNATFLRMNSGTINPAAYNISTFAGDIITTGSTNQVSIATVGGGIALLDGIGIQNINGDIATNPIFGRLRINKSSGLVNLNIPVNILTNIDLINGILNSTATNLLILNDNATATNASDNSFVNGPVRKIGNDAFTFPIGKNNFYRPISISAPSNPNHHFTAEYFMNDPHPTYNDASLAPTLSHISDCEYWILNRTNGNSNVNVTLSWNLYDPINNCSGTVNNLSQMRVARWNGTQWIDHGNGGTTGGISNGTVVTSAPVTSFSPFTLAATTFANPLPVELLSFTAEAKENIVVLNWTTASEINNDYFEIQKSLDGINFESFAKVKGSGFSNQILNYSQIDSKPYIGTSYYRLKQVDFDGTYSYSQINAVNFRQNISNVSFFPNPTNGTITISNLNENEFYTLQIFDVTGKLIDFKSVDKNSANNINLSTLSSGFYTIQLFSVNELIFVGKLVKK